MIFAALRRNAICKVKITTATATRRNLKKRGIAATAMRRYGSKNYSPLPRRCRSVMLKTINVAAPPPPQRERRGGGSATMDISVLYILRTVHENKKNHK